MDASMDDLDRALAQLSAAEEFFELLEVSYEPAVVHVNRLHILKRFQQYLRREGRALGEPLALRRAHHQRWLQQAYADFVQSTAAREKVFKVFQDAEGQHVSIEQLQASLAERKSEAGKIPALRDAG